MNTLYAPWRLDYIQSVSDGPKECFLCAAAKTPELDAQNLILARTPHCMLMLNKYPYVNGHLLVAPYRHAPTPVECTPEERADTMELLTLGQQALARAMNPQGFNIGFNIGKCSGAGVPGHIHAHLVPRWNGDINFMTIIANVRIIPQAIEEAYKQLQSAVQSLAAPRNLPPKFSRPFQPSIRECKGYNLIMSTAPIHANVVDQVMVALTRQKTPAQLTLLASRMFSQNRDRLKSYLRHIHPDWTDAQIHDELLRRIHGTA